MADGVVRRTITCEIADGPVEKVHSGHVWLNQIAPGEQTKAPSVDKPLTDIPDTDFSNNNDQPLPEEESNSMGQHKTQHYYLQQFVNCIHPMLDALLSCEALDQKPDCSHCERGNIARWQCQDCTSPRLMCQGCMQINDMGNPLH